MPLRRSTQAFVEDASRPVTGKVRMSLSKGIATATGRRSPRALYDHNLATYGAGDSFRHKASEGFIEIFGLGPRTAGEVARKSKAKSAPRARAGR